MAMFSRQGNTNTMLAFLGSRKRSITQGKVGRASNRRSSRLSLTLGILLCIALMISLVQSGYYMGVTYSSLILGPGEEQVQRHQHQNGIVHAYRAHMASSSFVDRQRLSWDKIVGLAADDLSTTANISGSDQTGTRSHGDANQARGVNAIANTISMHRILSKDDEKIVWDAESDISTYFNELMARCSRLNFDYRGCFGYLHSLVASPLCTTRLDSRYTCNGTPFKTTESIDAMIAGHLLDDTINVIVIGAGPVGLLLANSLNELGGAKQQRKEEQHDISIRTLVFENRLAATSTGTRSMPMLLGRKKPYTRDWLTALNSDFFDGTIDSRIYNFFKLIFRKKFISLPIAAIETLLMLSCRDRGVKLVYGDYRDHIETLKNVHNAIIFDATGRRLDLAVAESPYDRSDVGGKPRHLTNYSVPLIVERNTAVDVAEQQTITGLVRYPINRANNMPFEIHYLKISKIWSNHNDTIYKEMKRLTRVLDSSNKASRFCRQLCIKSGSAESNIPEYASDKCDKWCTIGNAYDYKYYYRSDIELAMNRVLPGDELFSTALLTLALLPKQAAAFKSLLGGKLAIDVPLRDLNVEAMLNDSELQRNGVVAFLNLAVAANRTDVLFSLFSYRPFIYPDPLVPAHGVGPHLSQLGFPVLRIGDSLFTGDPNTGNGLSHHVELVRNLMGVLKKV